VGFQRAEEDWGRVREGIVEEAEAEAEAGL
jgi:hypothetical protein